MTLIKKSDLLGCSDADYSMLFTSVKDAVLGKATDETEWILGVRKIMDQYRNTPLCAPAFYLLGEILGKIDLGAEMVEKTDLMIKNLSNQIKSESNTVDSLLKNYKPTKRVVN